MSCMWAAMPHKHQMFTQVQDSKRTMHKSQIEDNGRDSSSTTLTSGNTKFRWHKKVTTVMTQPVQVPPPQTIQINQNNEIGGWMNTQVGVIDAPTAGVSFSQTHVHIRDLILLDSQSFVDYFTNP